MKKVLITGANGFLGQHLVSHLKSSMQVIPLYSSNEPLFNRNLPWRKIDLVDPNCFKSVETDVDYIIHLAALSDPNQCEEYSGFSEKINLEGTKKVCDLASEQNCKLIFTSTDLVYDGVSGNYSEDSDINPKNFYAEHKVLGEEYINRFKPDSLILRLSVQLSKSYKGSFLSFIQDAIHRNDLLTLFNDEIRHFSLAEDTSNMITKIMDKEGLFLTASNEAYSRVELAKMLMDRMGKYTEINAISNSSINAKAFRPKDLSLNLSKLNEILGKEVNLSQSLD